MSQSPRATDLSIERLERFAGQPLQRALGRAPADANCPVAGPMGMTPADIARRLAEGGIDDVLRHHAIWVCTGCRACEKLLGADIDFARVLDALRHMALDAEGSSGGGPSGGQRPEAAFYLRFARAVARRGRLPERAVLGPYIARAGGSGLALALFFKGKLRLRRSRLRGWGPVELFKK